MSLVYDILEDCDLDLPPEPGTVSIPYDHVRLYHQTREENCESIRRNGIQFSYARGYEGPKAIYADETGFYGKPGGDTPTIEFHVHRNRWDKPFVTGEDVSPSEIIAVHLPWHQHARYILNDSRLKQEVLAGEHDNLLNDRRYGTAIRYVKRMYG